MGIRFDLNKEENSVIFFFSSRRRHTSVGCDWSSDVCSSDLLAQEEMALVAFELVQSPVLLFVPQVVLGAFFAVRLVL